MSIKLELDADSIKKAITTHISNQGFDLAGKTVEVALVNGRGGNGNRATIVISDEIIVNKLKDDNTVPEKAAPAPIEVVAPSEEEADPVSDLIMQGVENDILAAAEAAPLEEPAEGMEEFFPKVDPTAVETSKSLF